MGSADSSSRAFLASGGLPARLDLAAFGFRPIFGAMRQQVSSLVEFEQGFDQRLLR